jgi:ketosteroid isomerase-like protein
MRSGTRRTAVAVIVLVAALASIASALAADKVREAVDRGNRAFLGAYAAHDSAKIAGLYAPSAAAFPPGAARADGREAIRKVWQGYMDAGVTNVTLRTGEVEVRGDLAYESGEYALDAPGKDGKLGHSVGKYVVVWKRGKGGWHLYRDIWNDTPAR